MKACITSGERELTLPQLGANATRAAAALRSIGIGKDDSIALLLRNDFPYLEVSWAAAMIGAYPVPVNWHFTAEEAGYIVRDCGAKAIVVHTDLLPAVRRELPPEVKILAVATPPEIRAAFGLDESCAEVPPDGVEWSRWIAGFEPAQVGVLEPPGTMIYTSGTTGRPKGVRRERPSPEQVAQVRTVLSRAALGIEGPVATVIVGPMYHSAPNGYALTAASFGGHVILQPRFDPEELLQLIERHRVSHLTMVPTMFVRLLQLPEEVRRRYDVSSLRFVVHGAAPCPPEVKRRMIEWWGPVIYEFYGATETGVVARCSAREWLERPGTVGRAIPGARIRVLDDEGNELPPGVPGEIYSRLEYYSDFTYHGDERRRREIERDGLIASGDVGYLDADGYLYLCDRKRDMVISGGVNIYPAEIEAEIQALAGVRDCAVFGIPDEEFGESLCAYVQPAPGAALDADRVREALRDRLAGYKVPKVIEIRAELPREDSGKIFKRRLRDPYWKDAGRRI